MNTSDGSMIGILITVGVLLLLWWLIPSKGKVGEKVVAGKLDHLPKDQYRVLNNVTIPTPKGSSQIDHLVVSIYGIFVIETKNYNGWIYGSDSSYSGLNTALAAAGGNSSKFKEDVYWSSSEAGGGKAWSVLLSDGDTMWLDDFVSTSSNVRACLAF